MREMEIWEFAERYKLEEKIFIVPNRSIGTLMINDMARKGRSILNLNPFSLKKLSLLICQRYIWENDILLIDDILGKSIVLDCLKEIGRKDKDFFFKPNLIDERTAQEVYNVIIELKSQKIDIIPKEKNLDKIYESYNLKLKFLNAMDYCDVIKKAGEVKELSIFKDKIIGVAQNIEFDGLERELFTLLNKDAIRIKMPVKGAISSPKQYFFKENIESMSLDKEIYFFSEFGIRNEIKYIIDDILEKNIPLDEVVISYTDSKYVEAINLEFQKEGLGISFGDGLNILSSTSYRFIRTLFSFARNYYSISEIRPMFFDGSLNIKSQEEDIMGNFMYEELIRYKVFYEKKDYEKLNSIAQDIDDETRFKREWLKMFFEDVFFTLPEGKFEFNEYVKRLSKLIKKYVKILENDNGNSYDKIAMDAIIQNLRNMERIPLNIKRDEYFDIVLSYIEEIKINMEGTKPSRVFACKYNMAGYTGRKHLYLIGLDSSSLDSKMVESPILLDDLRHDISSRLSFSKENYRYKRYKIREALTANFTNISIGYSNFDTVDVKGRTPSKIYTELKEEYGHEKSFKSIPNILVAKDLVFSGTDLEILGQCSRKLYFRRGLSLKEKEDTEVNLDRWLDPLTKGSLVHEILDIYFNLAKDDRVEERLVEIIDKKCEDIQREVSYILKEVYNREKQEIKDYCMAVIKRERQSELEVFITELSFGTGKGNDVFGILEKQKIVIGDLNLYIIGSIDRVDIDTDKKLFKIIDYKTGSLKNFEKRLRKSEGRGKNKVYDYNTGQKFQFYIYKKALENIIRTREEFKDYNIESFSYEFKDDSINLVFDENFLAGIEDRIKGLLEIDIFEADKTIIYDESDELRCKYCEFKNICKSDKKENYHKEEAN